MLIEVSGNSRPAKPALAIVVTATLLLLTITGAAWLSRVRNHPVNLGAPHLVQGIQGVRIAWPEGWQPFRMPARTRTAMVAVAEPDQEQSHRILILLARRMPEAETSPDQAARSLLEVTSMLGLRPVTRQLPVSQGAMAGLPAAQVRFPVQYQDQLFWLELRAVCESGGRAIGLVLLCPDQISPADEAVLDKVSDSLQLSQSSPGNRQLNSEPQDEPSGHHPI